MASIIQINPIRSLRNIVGQYNFVIFVVVISCLLIFAVTILTTTLVQDTEKGSVTTTNFDQITINRLNGFETSANNTSFNNLPAGRINPFFE